MTKIPPKPKNDQNTPRPFIKKKERKTEIPSKPRKWLKYPKNLKIDQNTPKPKMTKIPPKPKN